MILFTEAEGPADRDGRIEALILAMSNGDMSAMGELYLLTKASVYAYALSKTANRELAEDITHDTFVRIYKYSTRYTPMGKPMAWIISIELNVIRRHYNKAKQALIVESVEQEADERDAVEDMIASELVRDLMRALSEGDREIVVLHAVAGLKHREIARLLGMPLATVLSKYSRAIKKLQKIAKEREDA